MFTYGFNTSFRYKNIMLTANFVGSYGNDLYNVNKMMDTNTTQTYSNVTRLFVNFIYSLWCFFI